MPKILPVLLFAISQYAIRYPLYANANYSSAYSDYSYSYTKYRTTYNAYQIAKSSYLTYRTLVSQNEAQNKLRDVLTARDTVISSYYNLLQEKLNDTIGTTDANKETFNKIKESEKSWLTDHQKTIEASASLEDLNQASADFENHYPQMDVEAKQTIGAILTAKEMTLSSRLDTFNSDLTNKLTEIRQAGEDTTFADRGMINVKNKLDLYKVKMAKVSETFSADKSSISLTEGQQRLQEANQYLREATNYLTEIIKSLTG